MSWFVVLPAAWFGIALALGLLVGRCLHVEGIAQPAGPALAEGPAAPTVADTISSEDDGHAALVADRAMAPTV